MTTFSGEYTPWDAHVLQAQEPVFISGVLADISIADSQTASAAHRTFAGPLPFISQTFSGAFQREYFDDFYGRVYAVPALLDFGVIASNVAQNVGIWNAHLDDVTLVSLTPLPAAQNVSIAGIAVGQTLKPLQAISTTFTAGATGASTISGTVIFGFGGESASVVVAGVRASLFPYQVDWRDSYKVVREFRTTVQTSRSGKEQRRAMRNRPRKSLEFTVTVFAGALRAAQRDLTKNVGYTMTLPDETRFVKSTAVAASGGLSINVESAPAWIAGQVLLRTETTSVVKQVAGVSGNTVTFTEEFANDWPIGTQLHPLLSGRISNPASFSLLSDNTATGTITFNVMPTSEVSIEPPAAPVTFNGREVVLLKPNWASTPKVEFSRPFETVDYNQGPVAYFNPVAYVSRTQQLGFTAFSPDQVALIEDVFERAKGQRGEFYMPTWQDDIPLTANFPTDSATIKIPGLQFLTQYGSDTVFRALCIVFHDGAYMFERVVTIFNDTGDSVIECYPPFVRDVGPDTVAMVCWMPAHRFASDSLTSEWITNEVAQCQLSVVTVEDLDV